MSLSGNKPQALKELAPIESQLQTKIVQFIQGDLRKLSSIYNIYNKQQVILQSVIITKMFQEKSYNEDTKQIVKHLEYLFVHQNIFQTSTNTKLDTLETTTFDDWKINYFSPYKSTILTSNNDKIPVSET